MGRKNVECMKRLSEIQKLQDNWDEHGASAFSAEIIEKAKRLVKSLPVQPDIFPTGRDSIQMEYENKRGDYLEFELFEDGRLTMFAELDGRYVEGDISAHSAGRIVKKFMHT